MGQNKRVPESGRDRGEWDKLNFQELQSTESGKERESVNE